MSEPRKRRKQPLVQSVEDLTAVGYVVLTASQAASLAAAEAELETLQRGIQYAIEESPDPLDTLRRLLISSWERTGIRQREDGQPEPDDGRTSPESLGRPHAPSAALSSDGAVECVCGEINTRHCPVHSVPLSVRPTGEGEG